MSLSTRTYDELKLQVEAMVGKDLTPKQVVRMNSNINLAAKRAYDRSKWWERFLIVAEPRTSSRGYVDFTEDSFHVYGAGTSGVDGLYVRNGTVNTKAAYRLYDSDGTTELYSIEWDGSTDWQLLDSSDNIIYDITDSSTTPPTSGWAANTGTAPAPLLVDVAEIKTVIAIHAYKNYGSDWSEQVEFAASSRGIYLTFCQSLNPVYVTYKKVLTDRYGDGTGGTTSTIPEEWFYYMALYAARQQQITEQVGDVGAGIQSREVEEALLDELEKLEVQRTAAALNINRSSYRVSDTSL